MIAGLDCRDDLTMLIQERRDRRVACRLCEDPDGFLFEKKPELEGFANEVQVDMGNLKPALRHRLDQALGF